MGRFKHDEVSHYGGSGSSGYFSLKDNGDTAQVRFMYNGIDDVDGYAVHQVEIDGRRRWVNCLRDYNSPVDDCPFCREKKFQSAKLFVPIFNEDTGKVEVWERGKTFFGTIGGLIARYSNTDTPFVSQVFEIERQGKKGDQTTKYGIYPVGQPDDTTLEDLPELPNIIGGIVLDKSADDMEYYLETGEFPPEENEEFEGRASRNERSQRREPQEPRRAERRTPANNRGNRRRDAF